MISSPEFSRILNMSAIKRFAIRLDKSKIVLNGEDNKWLEGECLVALLLTSVLWLPEESGRYKGS